MDIYRALLRLCLNAGPIKEIAEITTGQLCIEHYLVRDSYR